MQVFDLFVEGNEDDYVYVYVDVDDHEDNDEVDDAKHNDDYHLVDVDHLHLAFRIRGSVLQNLAL